MFNKFLSESRINPVIPVKLEPVEYSSNAANKKSEHVFLDKYSSRQQKVTKGSQSLLYIHFDIPGSV